MHVYNLLVGSSAGLYLLWLFSWSEMNLTVVCYVVPLALSKHIIIEELMKIFMHSVSTLLNFATLLIFTPLCFQVFCDYIYHYWVTYIEDTMRCLCLRNKMLSVYLMLVSHMYYEMCDIMHGLYPWLHVNITMTTLFIRCWFLSFKIYGIKWVQIAWMEARSYHPSCNIVSSTACLNHMSQVNLSSFIATMKQYMMHWP